ncbi:MAG: hydroxylamine reductase, partial [Selenomonadales bacterium]|nr:hydroxylamine reductase [Selenomonadales bacterium]
MEKKMFCFQCEQTRNCTGCTGAAGACGKLAGTAKLQDKLTGALIGLARAAEGNEALITPATDKLILKGLFTTVTNVNFNNETIQAIIDDIHAEASRLSGSGKVHDYDMEQLWNAHEDIRSLKSLILFGLRGMSAYTHHSAVLGYTDDAVLAFFYQGLRAIGQDDWGMNELLPIVMKLGEVNLTGMALLDQANTETYGNPTPTEVTLTVEKGPFIVITGHDLYDLKELLEQT